MEEKEGIMGELNIEGTETDKTNDKKTMDE